MSKPLKARARTYRDVRALHKSRKDAAQARRAAAAAGIGQLPTQITPTEETQPA